MTITSLIISDIPCSANFVNVSNASLVIVFTFSGSTLYDTTLDNDSCIEY